jgi:cell division protein ZapA
VAELNIEVNGRTYAVGCEDGQEDHLRALAAVVDAQVRQVGQSGAQLGETRLMLMGALLVADLYSELKGRIATLEGEVAGLRADQSRAELRAVAALENAAQRIEALAADEG